MCDDEFKDFLNLHWPALSSNFVLTDEILMDLLTRKVLLEFEYEDMKCQKTLTRRAITFYEVLLGHPARMKGQVPTMLEVFQHNQRSGVVSVLKQWPPGQRVQAEIQESKAPLSGSLNTLAAPPVHVQLMHGLPNVVLSHQLKSDFAQAAPRQRSGHHFEIPALQPPVPVLPEFRSLRNQEKPKFLATVPQPAQHQRQVSNAQHQDQVSRNQLEPGLQNPQAQVPLTYGGSQYQVHALFSGDGDSRLFISELTNHREDLLKKTEIRDIRQLKNLSNSGCISTAETIEISAHSEVVMERRVLVFLDILAKKQPPYLDLLNKLIISFDDPLNHGTADIFRNIRGKMFPQFKDHPGNAITLGGNREPFDGSTTYTTTNIIKPLACLELPQLQNGPLAQLSAPPSTRIPAASTTSAYCAPMLPEELHCGGFKWYLEDAGRLWFSTSKEILENDVKKYSPKLVNLITQSPEVASVPGTINAITFAGPEIPVDTVLKILSPQKWKSDFNVDTLIFVNVYFTHEQWAQKRSRLKKIFGHTGRLHSGMLNTVKNIQLIFDDNQLLQTTKIAVLIKPIVQLLTDETLKASIQAWSSTDSIDFEVLVNDYKVLRYHTPGNVGSKRLVVARSPAVSRDACRVNKVLQSLTNTLDGFSGYDICASIKQSSLQSASLTYLNLNCCFIENDKTFKDSYSQMFFRRLPSLQTLIVVGCKLQLDLGELAGNGTLRELVIANDDVYLPATRSDFEQLTKTNNGLGGKRKIVICGCNVKTSEARQYMGIGSDVEPYWLITNYDAKSGGSGSFGKARPLLWRFGGCKSTGAFNEVQAQQDRLEVLNMICVSDFMDHDFFNQYCKF